jgi:hypothetical protein
MEASSFDAELLELAISLLNNLDVKTHGCTGIDTALFDR